MRTNLIIILSLMVLVAFGQTSTKNYVRTISARQALTGDLTTKNSSETMQQVQYVDGLGRPSQSVVRWGSPDGKDMVVPIEYDAFGRQVKNYLPYESGQTSGNFRSSAKNEQLSDYKTLFSANAWNHASDGDYAYSETVLDGSPLNRVVAEASPGYGWRAGGGANITMSYETNVSADQVKLYSYDDLQVSARTNYGVGELQKIVTTGEDGNQTISFTNKIGEEVLRRSFTGSEWADTYFIYDEFRRLRVVLPPESNKAVAGRMAEVDGYNTIDEDQSVTANGNYVYGTNATVTIPAGTTLTNGHITPLEVLDPTFLKTWAYVYEYDARDRMISKQLPGAEPIYMVYDKWDRVVLKQDGVQRKNNQWQYTAYDDLSRPVITGLLTDTRSHSSMQSHIMSLSARGLSYDGSGIHGYDNGAYPFVGGSGGTLGDILTVAYYDNYNFKSKLSVLSSTTDYQKPSHFTAPDDTYILPAKHSPVKGMVTGTKIRKLDASTETFFENITFYDNKYRPIQVVSTNNMGGINIFSNQYDFVGNVRRSQLENSDGTITTTIKRRFEYDHMDRLLDVFHQIDSIPEVRLVRHEYNEIGQLVEKDLHSGEQLVDYAYNIRGWLTGINNSQLNEPNEDDLFGMELFYNTSSGMSGHENRFNGNVAAVRWSNYDPDGTGFTRRGYEFDYDGLDRLTDANHFRNYNTATSEYDMKVTSYDLNGNIKSLTRQGKNGENIDNLTYNHSGNQVQKVDDSGNDSKGFTESGSGTDYTYDENGNMVTDANKGITGIEYNYLNLPSRIEMGADNYITYEYNAAGVKLQQKVFENGSLAKTTDYLNDIIYEDGTIKQIQHGEGRIVPKGGGWDYQYHLKDHVGNVRLTFSTATPDSYANTATFEDGAVSAETLVFGNIDTPNRVSHPAGGKGARLNNATPAGPFVVLSINKGDKVDLSVDGYYSGGSGYSSAIAASVLDDALSQAVQQAGALEGLASSSIDNGIGAAIAAMGVGGSSNDNIPGAYLTYMIFDRDMNYEDIYGYVQIGSAANGSRQTIDLSNISIDRDGYLVAYLSNESNSANYVYFDNFTVAHEKTNIVSTQDYYPFGLTFNASVRTASTPQNWKYNGVEENPFTKNLETVFRQYDPSIGLFTRIDPLAEIIPGVNPYHFGYNNPVRFNDPLGLLGDDKVGADGLTNEQWIAATRPTFNRNKKTAEHYRDQNRAKEREQAREEKRQKDAFEEIFSDPFIEVFRIIEGNIAHIVYSGYLMQFLGEQEVDYGGAIDAAMRTVNTSVGGVSTYTVYSGKYHKWNEVWHKYKRAGTAWRWQKGRWNNFGAKATRAKQANSVAKPRALNGALTKAGGVLLVADIALSGELKPSHAINAAMLGASTTGVGAIVAGVWFIADFGTMGVNYLVSGEAKGLGDMIDESVGTVELYEGVY